MKFNQFTLLKTRRFSPLFVTQFLGALNDNIFKNALVILITYRLATASAMNSQILVTFAAGIFILPFFLFSALAGQLADKYEKAKIISIIKFIEIILMAVATLGFYLQNMWLLMLVLLALGIHATFFGPVKYAILPDALREDELIAGNGLIEAGTFLAILFGTILGSMLILQNNGEVLISVILLIAAIVGWFGSKFINKTNNYNPEIKLNYNFIKETFRVIQYAKNRADIFLAILGISWFWLIGAVYLAELPVFARDVLYADEGVVTFFLTLFSVGFAIGSLLCNKLLKGKVHATYVPLGALCITIFAIDLYFASSNITDLVQHNLISLNQFLHSITGWRITIDLTLIAVGGGLYTVPLYAILQQRSAKTHRARVIASNNVMNALFMVIAAMMTMVMLKFGFLINQVFLVIAVLNTLVAIYICKLLPEVFVKSFFRSLLKILYRVEVTGLENYYKAGDRVVIVANHTSFLDALLLAIYLPDKLSFAVNKTTAQKWWIRLFLRLVEAFPLEPTNPMALKSLIEFVKQDKRCVIFPEGRLTMTGALMKIYEGPGLVADKSKAKLLPIRIQGAQFTPFSRLKGKVRIHFMPKITLTIFPPQDLEIPIEVKGRERRQLISLKLYDLMTNILFESSDYHQTLFAALLHAKAAHGRSHLILEDIEREKLTYQQFITRCYILGGVLNKHTAPAENIGILLPNMISNVLTFFALQAYGRVPAMLNYSTGITNVVLACQTAQVKIVYSSRKFVRLAKLTDMITELKKTGVQVVYLEEVSSKIGMWDKIKGILLAQFPALIYKYINSNVCDPENPAVILFTSGSEGTPKGVVLSHSNIQANRYQLSACIDFTASDKIFNALPIFHSFGLTGGTLLPLLSGIKTFLYPSPLHYRIVPELIYDTNATIVFGTDTFLSGYAKYAHPYDFYSVRYVFAGAEKLREDTRLTWSQKFGIRILEGYGATETSPVLAINTPMQHKAGTVGRFLPGIHYRLAEVPGVMDGGVLNVTGPNIMQGYLLASAPGVLVPPLNNWYDTGDIVSVDEMGFVTIKGRVKRFAKIAGEMVSLTMVEQYINKLWPDYQHAVISIPDPKKGEQLVLVTTNLDAVREDLVNFAKVHQLGEIMVPKQIITVKKMFLLGTGKIDYPAVKAFVEQASLP